MHPSLPVRLLSAVAIPLLLGGCLEHREKITVAENGSVEVSVLATGGARDLADAALVPSGPRWTTQGKDAAAWAEHVPAGRPVDTPFDEKPWRAADGSVREDVEIGARGTFPSVGDLPSSYAAPGDPYAEASLRFSTTLEVRPERGHTLYVFERTYHALPGAVFRLWKHAEKRVEKAVNDLGRIWSDDLSPDEKKEVSAALAEACLLVGERLAVDALGAHYLHGGGTLPLTERARVLTEMRAAVGAFATPEQFSAWLEAERAGVKRADVKRADGGEPPAGPSPLERFDLEFRSVLRATLRSSLERTGLAQGEVNGVVRALELAFVGSDRAQDLDDESFAVEVSLPGTVVAGNFAVAEGSTARFAFRGEDLRDKDVVLRVVSSLEHDR